MKQRSEIYPKTKVAIVFGGMSAEHEISVLSAESVTRALDKSLFESVLIGISKDGSWRRVNKPSELKEATSKESHTSMPNLHLLEGVDVVFPVLHGPMGEDGTMQGLLQLVGIPYVGCNVLGSAIGMDKDVMKRLLRDAGIAIAPFHVVSAHTRPHLDIEKIVRTLGLPLFVKPANMGSSVGVSKVLNAAELADAVDRALAFDAKVLIETAVVGEEIECGVLGNENPEASVVGRVIPRDSFYSYEAKYHDEDGTILEIPAKIPGDAARHARKLALQAYEVLDCRGMARVDMFLTTGGSIVVNEINTIPGFTQFSMYPQLWEAKGLAYTTLITRLLELAENARR